MTPNLFLLLISLIILGALAAFALITRPAFASFSGRVGVMPPPMIGAISILFGLFIGFSSADIGQRASALLLATQREVSAARSIVNFSTGVGPKAAPVLNALLDYLEVVTTSEPAWLRDGGQSDPPGAASAYSLSLAATGFVQEASVSDVLKSALIARVDELVAARTDRLTLARAAGSVPQWLGLTALAILTLLVGATSAPQRGGSAIFLVGYTATAIIALFYLAYSDGLLGASRADEQTRPFKVLLTQAPNLSGQGDDPLSRIRAGGPVVIGARTDQYPFAFIDAHGEHVGYSIDICRSIIAHLHDAKLGAASPASPPVHPELLRLSPANRVALVVNGTADMECDLTTKTATRDAQLLFLDSIFFGHAEIATRVDSGITSLEGLKQKRLIAVTGSSNMQAAIELNAMHGLDVTIVPAKDMPTAFDMLGKAAGDALLASDVLNRALINGAADPSSYRTFAADLPARAYGIMARRANTAFANAANDTLTSMLRSGELETIYKRWFESYEDAGHRSLQMPMTAELRSSLEKAMTDQPH